jgi:hypothetical protein
MLRFFVSARPPQSSPRSASGDNSRFRALERSAKACGP